MDSELLVELETSLVSLLSKVKDDPWSLLMFQALLWSFRRWAIHHLMTDLEDPLRDCLWDSHIDLIREFAPDGLKDFGVIWLSPSNVGERVDVLEELNEYFLFIVDKIEDAINSDLAEDQNSLATFLDDTITYIIDDWLEGRTEYRIYPLDEESPDTFPSERIFHIMQLIVETHLRPAPASAPEPAPEPAQEPAPEPAPEPVPEPVPEPIPVPEPAPPTVKTALARKRTLRLHRKALGKQTRKNRGALLVSA